MFAVLASSDDDAGDSDGEDVTADGFAVADARADDLARRLDAFTQILNQTHETIEPINAVELLSVMPVAPSRPK